MGASDSKNSQSKGSCSEEVPGQAHNKKQTLKTGHVIGQQT